MAVVVEIRAGEGGEDAALFRDELCSSILGLARRLGHQVSETTGGQGRTIRLVIDGPPGPYLVLAGVHRIQRVPSNSTRRHTSTATVAVLDDIAAEEVALSDDDLDISAYRGSGPGGQHRNKSHTAVRVTHRPSGLVASAEDSRSQWQNLQAAKAKIAKALLVVDEGTRTGATSEQRNAQIGSCERSAKSFTHRETGSHACVVCHETGQRWRLEDFRKGRIAS
ncbi:MAG: peptide chain release factor-like protein [Acidimicrobiales bacterium]